MRSVFISGYKPDKKHLIGAIVAVILAIISNIVLYKYIRNNIFMWNYASKYVYYVYNFANGKLFIYTLLKEALYLYIGFCIARFTRFKLLTLPLYFLKSFVGVAYIILLFTAGISGGFLVAVLVFVPSTFVSLILQFIVTESSRLWNNKVWLFIPIAFSASESIFLLLITNVFFRLIVYIV